MFAPTLLAMALLAAPLYVQAAPEWVALEGSDSNTTFVNQVSIDNRGQYVDVDVLRDFPELITLGNDSITNEPLYPHRSVTLNYKVDCASNRLAMNEWQMFEGNLAQGKVIWHQKNINGLAFVTAADSEMRAVLHVACATTTVSR